MHRRFSAHPGPGDRPGRNENERDEVLSQQVAKRAAAVIIGFESISLFVLTQKKFLDKLLQIAVIIAA
jgi:hypothetical protein